MLEALCIAEGIGIVFLLAYITYLKYQSNRMIERKTGKVRERYMKAHKGVKGRYICAYCFKPVKANKMNVDHIYPFDRGGSNKCWNLVAACERCNKKKSDKAGLWVVRGYFGKLILENGILLIVAIAVLFMYLMMR